MIVFSCFIWKLFFSACSFRFAPQDLIPTTLSQVFLRGLEFSFSVKSCCMQHFLFQHFTASHNTLFIFPFDRFKVVDLLTMASQHQNAVLDSEQERPMLEGALTFLVILTSLRIHLGKFYESFCFMSTIVPTIITLTWFIYCKPRCCWLCFFPQLWES